MSQLPECVEERRDHKHYRWHLVDGEGDDWFRPIACDGSEGIVLPGPGYWRQPTCVECYAIWRQNDASPASARPTRPLHRQKEGATGE